MVNCFKGGCKFLSSIKGRGIWPDERLSQSEERLFSAETVTSGTRCCMTEILSTFEIIRPFN
jgi:hypothetical protein